MSNTSTNIKLEKTPPYKLYVLLHLSRYASAEDIKKAYKKAALIHHPDKGGDPEKFKEIVNAFKILNDPEKKKRYDESEERVYKTDLRKVTSVQRNTREGPRERRVYKSDLRKEAPVRENTRQEVPREERVYKTDLRKEAPVQRNTRQEVPREERVYKTNFRKEAMVHKTTREGGLLDKKFSNSFQHHFGAGSKDLSKGRRTTEDNDLTKGCKKIIFHHFPMI